ncbi:MAG: tol-pal system-associated acyl-CoA thioesterase [Proteobacteria bacterium]|nr:tol-pal system-associated acyl-CoA thioesterase [Pseudomonadota bacterium]
MKNDNNSSKSLETIDIRVYYEDTDAGRVVYYANYLKFAERGRTEYLRVHNIENSKLAEETGVFVVVRHLEVDYRAAARLDDLLTVETRVVDLGKASFTMQQDIKRGATLLVTLKVVLACMGQDGRAARMPQALRTILEG